MLSGASDITGMTRQANFDGASVRGTKTASNDANLTKEENMQNLIKRFVREEEGATAVEYGVLIALIIAVCIIVIWGIGKQVNNAFDKVNKALLKATGG